MRNEQTSLVKSEKIPKFSVGPTSPNPGPMFPRQDAAAETEDIKSYPLKEMSMIPAKSVAIYIKIKFVILITTSLESSVPFTRTGIILLG